MPFGAGGSLYVTDFSSGAVRSISPIGVDLGNFVTGFSGAEGIAFDATGNVYLANDPRNIVEKYSASGADLGVFAAVGPAGGGGAYGLAFDAGGNLFAADYGARATDI
jgi:DNA-binding beta-propeller fold protein YncE